MNTQQFFQQPQEQNEDDQDQDYQPEEEEESSSSESEGLEEDVQEEVYLKIKQFYQSFQYQQIQKKDYLQLIIICIEQFDDPDFDLQAYLKVRDQL